jgi:protein-L-isoaspartate(D-aspartate) O-methyltransferase
MEEMVVRDGAKTPRHRHRIPQAAIGRAPNVTQLVQQALETEGVTLPRPFGRVEAGAYVQDGELAAALRVARSLRRQEKAAAEPQAAQRRMSDPANSIGPLRRWYAEELRFTARVASAAVIDAFATVPRERFLGPGPWRVRSPMNLDGYWSTDDGNPRHVYHDVLIALDEARGINNGQPSLWARLFDALDLKPGEQVLHLGCGTGYYSAIAAELVGRTGRVDAIEIDGRLAAKARAALAPWPQAVVSNADGASTAFDPADVIIASAGATQPPRAWLDALGPGGRLLLPMTTREPLGAAELSSARVALSAGGGPGAILLVVRQQGEQFAARFLCRAGFVDFTGARSPAESRRLAASLSGDWGESVRSLRRDLHSENATCWLHGDGWCLSRCPIGGIAR